jgi:hypothetical protein
MTQIPTAHQSLKHPLRRRRTGLVLFAWSCVVLELLTALMALQFQGSFLADGRIDPVDLTSDEEEVRSGISWPLRSGTTSLVRICLVLNSKSLRQP